MADLPGSGVPVVDLIGPALPTDTSPRPIFASRSFHVLSGVGLRANLLGSGDLECTTGLALLLLATDSFLGAGLIVSVVDGDDVADLGVGVLMYFCDEARRVTGSGAFGSGFIGDRGGVFCCGLSARTSTLYLFVVVLAGTCTYISFATIKAVAELILRDSSDSQHLLFAASLQQSLPVVPAPCANDPLLTEESETLESTLPYFQSLPSRLNRVLPFDLPTTYQPVSYISQAPWSHPSPFVRPSARRS